MNFIDQLIQADQSLLIYLNGLGNGNWDPFWKAITHQFNWTFMFLIVIFLIFKHYGWKKGLFLVLFIALVGGFTDQFVNLIKNYFERLRPSNDPQIKELIRIVHRSRDFSFVSGHATNSFGLTTLIFLTLRKYFKGIIIMFIWPILFAYSRVYLGVHYPLDIFCGMLLGIGIGLTFYKISLKALQWPLLN